jgi:coenzyme F420-dependent glucose-6-phosphate dehydrogenase
VAKIGFTLCSEEFGPQELVRLAERAEEVGYDFLSISDHFHPWVDAQGHSPFVWGVLGGVAQVTERIEVGTGVTCPTQRIHPAIIAHASATAAAMLPGRFWLGIGSGENLNEHILGERWPETAVRQERMVEAIEVIRKLWEGHLTSHHGEHYTVENARLYTLPEEPPPIYIATAGERETEDEAKKTALKYWPNAVVGGNLVWELPLPSHFREASEWADEDAIAEEIVCATDAGPFVEAAKEFVDAGYDHVFFHQIGPQQDEFLRFSESEILPALQDVRG